MRGTAYYCTVEELQKRGRDDIPEQFRSNTHLIYSSPATLGTGMLRTEYVHDQFHAAV